MAGTTQRGSLDSSLDPSQESVVERGAEEQQALRALAGPPAAGPPSADPDSSGLLLIDGGDCEGGVGKSTLAMRILGRLDGQGRIVMSVRGRTSPDEILAEIGSRLLEKAIEFGLPEDEPNHRLAADVRRPDLDWAERFEKLSSRLFGAMPLIFLLDDFDVNLASAEAGYEIASDELAEFLGAWIASPGATRLAVTSRHEFPLPGVPTPRLVRVELGLPNADEAREIARRLPALAELDDGDRRRVCEGVGNHPLALRFADALVRDGVDPSEGLQFERLVERLKEGPGERREDTLAWRLLVGASVFRQPVDDVALLWQVGEEIEQDPALAERVRAFHETIEAAGSVGKSPTPTELGMTDEEFVNALSDMETWTKPPLSVPEGFGEAKEQLLRLGLLVAKSDGKATRWSVDRWTADRLSGLVEEDKLREGHHRAARNWRFRVQRTTEDVAEAVAQLLEARHHFHRSGALNEAIEVTERVCDQLEAWGAHRRIQELCREALGWSDEPSRQRAALWLQVGLAEERRGALDEAEPIYEQALQVAETIDDRAAAAGACHQLGRVAQSRGSQQEAVDWYRKSLTLSEKLGLAPGTAATISQLGALETQRGALEEGLKLNLQSLAIRLQLGSEEAGADVHWLQRQREELGAERFDELLEDEAGADGARNVLELLQELATAVGN